jgi:hypothetical protein
MEKILSKLEDYPLLYRYVLRSSEKNIEDNHLREQTPPLQQNCSSENILANSSEKPVSSDEKDINKAEIVTNHRRVFRNDFSRSSCINDGYTLCTIPIDENKSISVKAQTTSTSSQVSAASESSLAVHSELGSRNESSLAVHSELGSRNESSLTVHSVLLSEISLLLFKQVNDTPIHADNSEIVGEFYGSYIASRIAEIFTPKSNPMFSAHSLWCHRIIENVRSLYESDHYNSEWDFDGYMPPSRYVIDEEVVSLWNDFIRRRHKSTTEDLIPKTLPDNPSGTTCKLFSPQSEKSNTGSNKVFDIWKKVTLYHNINNYFKIAISSMYALTRSTSTNILNSDFPSKFLKYDDIERLTRHPLVICLSSSWATKDMKKQDEKKQNNCDEARSYHIFHDNFDDERSYHETRVFGKKRSLADMAVDFESCYGVSNGPIRRGSPEETVKDGLFYESKSDEEMKYVSSFTPVTTLPKPINAKMSYEDIENMITAFTREIFDSNRVISIDKEEEFMETGICIKDTLVM